MTTLTLNDGTKIPAVGFGVFLIPVGRAGLRCGADRARRRVPAHRHGGRLL